MSECLDDLVTRFAVAANAEFTEPLRLLADVIEYAEHASWRCNYRTRYKTCRCGLDDLMERLGLPPVPPDDPEMVGWSYGYNSLGEEIGYAVSANCGDCGAEINRGLAYTCGGLDGHSNGTPCGGAFCSEHLFYGAPGSHDGVCRDCYDELEADTCTCEMGEMGMVELLHPGCAIHDKEYDEK